MTNDSKNASDRLRDALGLTDRLLFTKNSGDASPQDLIELAEIHIKGAHNTMVDSFDMGGHLGASIRAGQAALAEGDVPEDQRAAFQAEIDSMDADLKSGMATAEQVALLQSGIGESLLELARTKLLSRDIDVRHSLLLASNEVQSEVMFGGLASDFLASPEGQSAGIQRDSDAVTKTTLGDESNN